MAISKKTGHVRPQLRIDEAVERFKSYIAANKKEEIRSAFSAKNISSSTLRNWANEPKKILSSYRRTEFLDAIGTLPDLDWERRNQAYSFALKELGIGIDGQHDLTAYHGNFRIFHDFPRIELHNFAIRVEHSPFVVIFAFKYRNENGHRGKCDGLVVLRYGRFFCGGFSPTTIFQAVFSCVSYPHEDLIPGMAFIEDLNTQEVFFSTVVLARAPNSVLSSQAVEIVRNSCRVL